MINRSFSRSLFWPILVLGCLLAPGSACRNTAPDGRPNDWKLRSYEVAPGDQQAVVGVLRGLLRNSEKIELSPDGRLILLASPSIHEQVQREIIGPLAGRPRAAAPRPPSLTITYWMVLARAGKPGDAETVPPGLQEIAPVLPEIRKTTGAGELILLERLRVASTEGEAKTTGRTFNIRQAASLAGDTVVSDVKIAGTFHMPPHFDRTNAVRDDIIATRIGLKPGQTVILGELGLRGMPAGLPKELRPPEAGDTLFVILQASVNDAVASK